MNPWACARRWLVAAALLAGLVAGVAGRAAAGQAATAAPEGPEGPRPHFQSGPARVALVELFTSEGCSSCPPAEAWLSALARSPGLWKTVVPVAFHVDYWDYLGWRDALAAPAFTARQYAYGADWGASSVYTPCVVRDGREWRPGRDPEPAVPVAGGGLLTLVAGDQPGRWTVRFTPAAGAPPGGWRAHVALLAGGIVSDVRAGENAGLTLTHDFAVVAIRDVALRPDPAAGATLAADVAVGARTPEGARRRSVAAWVTRGAALAPVQAVGGWLP